MNPGFVNKVFEVAEASFQEVAAAILQFQFNQNPVYRRFCQLLGYEPASGGSFCQVPFLPISFFKQEPVLSSNLVPAAVFESSGTTGQTTSRHFVQDLSVYERSFREGFHLQYGSPRNWCILGLLPSYLEREHSSLVYMVNDLVRTSGHPQSGFYLHNHAALHYTLCDLEAIQQPTLLIGVTYALLDFATTHRLACNHTVVMETGGMKGRREELVREEVHQRLREGFGVDSIHSEYGMTELLSQAYAAAEGRFRCPPWMRVLVRDEDDPRLVRSSGKGALNIIDLANIYSCSFLATDDVGEVFPDGSFRVVGRLDNSDIRGCSLLTL
ncbi:MAG TPA: acyl transferase [Lacibacter sp.]|nr:acyl transferase [Lacibacter sp.]HMO89425.1 acyl transferase [Lacibacter sp.]